MNSKIDFTKYKDRLVDYARSNGIQASDGINVSCFFPSHGSSDSSPSLSFKDNHYRCFKCNIAGDIYDLAGYFHKTDDKLEQYKIIEKFYDGVSWTPPPVKEKSHYNEKAAAKVCDYMREQAKENFNKVLSFAEKRGYGEDFALRLGYWPGLEKAIKDIGLETLKAALIPIPYKDSDGKNKGVSFKPSGVVFKYSKGFKLMYLKGSETIKRASWDADVFGYPKFFDGEKIVLVEAEISAIAMNLEDILTISTGGTQGLTENNAEKLFKYKTVVFCFDADDAGKEAALKGAKLLKTKGFPGSIKIANIEAKEGIKDPDDYVKNGFISKLKTFIDNAIEYQSNDLIDLPDEELEGKLPFKILGFSENCHYFLDRKDMITKIPAGKTNTTGMLLEVAPLDFWKTVKTNKEGNVDWTFVADKMIALSNAKGPYKKTMVRGAGVWKEGKEIVASDGEYIFCNAGKVLIKNYKSKNTYIRRADIGIDAVNNENATDDFRFIEWMIDNLPFAKQQDGRLLFGWIISSIFLSCIKWRPIAYIKGPSGVGKSWVMNNVVREILAGLCICPKKNSTVIGTAQAPGYDSRMTTVDEIEQSSNKRNQDLITGLMTLARDTTTESKELRFVGTSDQEGISSSFTSMFLFASIVESSEEDQDVNRITSIQFMPKKKEDWPKIEAEILYKINNGFGDRIRHSAIYHRQSIVRNIYLFQKIAGIMADKQRNGDQLGTLIAGYYHIEYPGKTATEEEATEYIKRFDFTEQNERNSGHSYKSFLSAILSYKIRYEETEIKTSDSGNPYDFIKMRERTVFDILQQLNRVYDDGVDITSHDLNKTLMGYGLRYGTRKNPQTLVIALNHGRVEKMFPDNFPYKHNYGDFIKNYENFICKEQSVKFLGSNHQAVVLKIDLSDDGPPEDEGDGIPF